MYEKNFNKDPGLSNNETVSQSNTSNDPYGFDEKMKDMPSFEEHMEQMQEDEDEMSM